MPITFYKSDTQEIKTFLEAKEYFQQKGANFPDQVERSYADFIKSSDEKYGEGQHIKFRDDLLHFHHAQGWGEIAGIIIGINKNTSPAPYGIYNFNCTIWARNFQLELSKARIEYQGLIIYTKRGHDPVVLRDDKHEPIGVDSHYATLIALGRYTRIIDNTGGYTIEQFNQRINFYVLPKALPSVAETDRSSSIAASVSQSNYPATAAISSAPATRVNEESSLADSDSASSSAEKDKGNFSLCTARLDSKAIMFGITEAKDGTPRGLQKKHTAPWTSFIAFASSAERNISAFSETGGSASGTSSKLGKPATKPGTSR